MVHVRTLCSVPESWGGLAINVHSHKVMELALIIHCNHNCPVPGKCQAFVSSLDLRYLETDQDATQRAMLAKQYGLGNVPQRYVLDMFRNNTRSRPYSYCLLQRRGSVMVLQRNELSITVDPNTITFREIWRWL